MIPLLILVLVALVGLMLFVRGWTGIVIDDHPICRRCGFDLFGLPSDATRCSECGADLTRPRAIRAGARARRPGLITSGVLLVALSTAALAMFGWARVSNFDITPWKPLTWIVADTMSPAPRVRSSAFVELLRRVGASELSTVDLDYVADTGLAHQADRSQAWIPEWGELIESLQKRGQLSADRWQRYAKQAGSLTLALRPQVRRGDPVPVRVAYSGWRVGNVPTAGGGLWQDMSFKQLTIAGSERRVGGSMGTSLSPGGGGSAGWNETLEPNVVAKLQNGPQPVRIVLEIRVSERVPWSASSSQDDAPPIVTDQVELNGTFELVGADAQTVKVVHAPEHTDAVRKAIKFRDVRHGENDDRRLSLMLDVDATPVTLAHDVIARAGGREVKLGTVTAHPGRGAGTSMSEKFPDLDTDRIDIVLRPNIEAAHRTTDVFQMWDGELVFEDVRVPRYDPATQKSR